MGLLLSVFAGKHICPGGEVKVWQRSAEQSLLVEITRQHLRDFMGVQQMVKDELQQGMWRFIDRGTQRKNRSSMLIKENANMFFSNRNNLFLPFVTIQTKRSVS